MSAVAAPDVSSGQFRWPEDRPGEQHTPHSPHEPPARGARTWQDWFAIGVMIAGAAAALWIHLAPLPAGLTREGKTAGAIFVLCTTLWVTNLLPIGITGLLAVALLGLLGAMPAGDAFAAFGSSAVFFILGVFIIAAALTKSGLSKRWALLFLAHFGRSPYVFATGMMLTSALATVFMPAQATAAMLFPIAFEVARAMRLQPGTSRYGKVLFLSLAWGAMVGSNASFLGSTRAALALGMLQKSFGITMTFAEWMIASVPLVLVGVATIPLVLRLSFGQEAVDFPAARRVLDEAVRALGPIHWPQVRVALVMLLTVGAWIFLAGRIDLAVIALLGATLMFATGALSWDDVDGKIYWSVILMYGGAIALAAALDRAGAVQWAMAHVFGDVRISPFAALAGMAIGTLFVSEFMSNAAAVAVMLPIGFTIAERTGVPPAAIMLATSFGAGLDFALPISSAPNTIAFASGYIRMTDLLRAGAVMTLASIAALLLVARFWWPLLSVFHAAAR